MLPEMCVTTDSVQEYSLKIELEGKGHEINFVGTLEELLSLLKYSINKYGTNIIHLELNKWK